MHPTKTHLAGRHPFEVPKRKWPVITRAALSDLQLTGEVSADWNPLTHALAAGYVWLANTRLWTQKALREAEKKNDPGLQKALERKLAQLSATLAGWPLTILG